jgi:hypothetical protein
VSGGTNSAAASGGGGSAHARVQWAINGGARVDYVLQESGLEAANEYLDLT